MLGMMTELCLSSNDWAALGTLSVGFSMPDAIKMRGRS